MARTDVEAPDVHTQEGAERNGVAEATDTVLGWVAMYLPSWGSSLLLHGAVLLLVAFFAAMPAGAGMDPVNYGCNIVPATHALVHKDRGSGKDRAAGKKGVASGAKRPGKGGEASRGAKTPQISGLLRQFTTNPFPGVAANGLNEVQVIGREAGGRELGGFEGWGRGSGRGVGTGGGGFFGAGGDDSDEANRIVYVVDRSGSMTDSIDYVKQELNRSLRELGPEKQFDIIFFSSGPALEMPARRLVGATEANKQKAFEFIDGIVAGGETDPAEALRRAFAAGPDVIYFLTDGEFDKSIVEEVRRANAGKKVTVHTIAFWYRDGEPLLRKIAADNGGNYKFVGEADLRW